MKKISICIVEDEQEQAKTLCGFIGDFSKEEGYEPTLTHFSSAIEAAENFKGQFDVLFLDIMMKGMTGMEFAHEVRSKDPSVMIIFVTSLTQFALEGYEVDATDYLVKPLSYPEFRVKMKRAFSKLSLDEAKLLSFSVSGSFYVVPISSIIYCETQGHSVIYHTESGDFKKHQPMKEAESFLPESEFIRINSCYLVAKKEIAGMDHHFVVLKNGERLLVSRPRLQAVSAFIKGAIDS